MNQSQKFILYTETLSTAKTVIPAKAGIQKNTGFRIKSGMTNYIRPVSSCIAMIFITTCILFGTTLIEPMMAYGQSRGKTGLSQESGRNPFVLPSGVRLLSQSETASVTKGALSTMEIKPMDSSPPPLKVNTILITDHIRLASIDRHIVTVGDSIHDEKILEIKNDRVVLGKGDKKRTLLLSQSPVQLTVEDR